MLFQKVLYPVDLKPASLNVKPYILKLKEAGTQEVHLLYVLVPSEWGLLERAEYDSEDKIDTLKGAMNEGYVEGLKKTFKKMQELAEEFEKNGIKTKVLMISGELDEVIADYAKKNGIQLVALGVTAETLSFFKVGKLLDIIKAVESPILIVKSPEKE